MQPARHSPTCTLPTMTKAPGLCVPARASLLPRAEIPLYPAMPLQCHTLVTSGRASWLCRVWGDALLALHEWVPAAQSH